MSVGAVAAGTSLQSYQPLQQASAASAAVDPDRDGDNDATESAAEKAREAAKASAPPVDANRGNNVNITV